MLQNTIEDYWEDSSVSLGCSSHGLLEISQNHVATSTSCPIYIPRRDPVSSQRSGEQAGLIQCHRRSRSFPPPISSCVTLSIKEGGRFVLKEMKSGSPHAFFHAERENGRLRLHFLPEQLDDVDDSDGTTRTDADEDEDTESFKDADLNELEEDAASYFEGDLLIENTVASTFDGLDVNNDAGDEDDMEATCSDFFEVVDELEQEKSYTSLLYDGQKEQMRVFSEVETIDGNGFRSKCVKEEI